MRRVVHLATLCLGVAAVLPSLAQAAPRHLSIRDAVELALKQNLEVKVSEAQRESTKQESRSVRGNLGPKLRAEANVFYWNSPFNASFDFGIPGAPVESIAIRDQLTSTVTLSGTESLTGAASVGLRYGATLALDQAAQADLQTTQAEVVFRATESYLRLLQAIDLRHIAEQAIADIDEQARIAKALVEAGTLIEADYLRTQVARAQAQQDLLRADALVGSTEAQLAALLGLPVDAQLAPEPIAAETLPTLPPVSDELLRTAQDHRPEVHAATARATAASRNSKAAWTDLLPQIAVTGAYQHNEGFGFIQPKDSAYIGGVLAWNFWEWGAQFYAAESAKAQAQLAQVDVERRRRDVALEVVRRLLDARAAFAAIDVARSAVTQAQEAYRVTRALYENGATTTTDVLDNELALERARVNDTRATYDALVAYAAFTRAAGTQARLPATKTN